jgi:eukaryotic-like serine/threonine-protein kinase
MSMSQVGSGLPRLLAERYELSERLAASGMTSIWRGHDRVLGRDVAIKVLHPELAADPSFRARFSEEAVNAARLTHPSIVALYDTGEENGAAYIVSEWVEGANLAELIARHGPLPPPRAARLASEVAMALDYAHGAGVLHRNLKSANILLTTDGAVKVGDFSIAKAASGEDPERTGEILGNLQHLAPEQVDGEAVDARTDVYALGVCLFEMLTGRPPPVDGDGSGQPAGLRSPRSLRAGIPRDLDAVVARAMAPNPAERFQSAQAMASALARSAADDDTDPEEAGAVGLPVLPHTPTRLAGSSALPRARPSWLGWALVLAGMAVVAAGVAWVLVQGARSGTGGGQGGSSPPSQPSAGQPAGSPIEVVGARSFDPGGTADADDPAGQEHEDQVDRAFDGDTDSRWETTGYNRPNLGGLKPGVGLILDLGSAKQARSLQLTVPVPGATVSIFGSTGEGGAPPDSIEAWGNPIAGPQSLESQSNTLRLAGAAPYRYYLIWFTELPREQDGGKYRGAVAEATLKS